MKEELIHDYKNAKLAAVESAIKEGVELPSSTIENIQAISLEDCEKTFEAAENLASIDEWPNTDNFEPEKYAVELVLLAKVHDSEEVSTETLANLWRL